MTRQPEGMDAERWGRAAVLAMLVAGLATTGYAARTGGWTPGIAAVAAVGTIVWAVSLVALALALELAGEREGPPVTRHRRYAGQVALLCVAGVATYAALGVVVAGLTGHPFFPGFGQ